VITNQLIIRAVKKTSLLVVMFCSLFSYQALSTQDSSPDQTFDEIDQMLERDFINKTAQIDKLYNAYSKAIDDAYRGVTKKISVEWPSDIKLPTKSTWVGYSKDLKSRTKVNFQQGEIVIEAKVENNNISKAKSAINALAEKMTAKDNQHIEQLDILNNELQKNLAKEGVKLQPAEIKAQTHQANILEKLLPQPQVINAISLDSIKVVTQPKVLDTATENMLSKASSSIDQPVASLHEINTSPKKIVALVNKAESVTSSAADIIADNISDKITDNIGNAVASTVTSTAAKLTAATTSAAAIAVPVAAVIENTTALLAENLKATAPPVNKAAEKAPADEKIALNSAASSAAKSPLTSTVTKAEIAHESSIKLELVKKGDDSVLKMTIKFVNNYQEVLMAHNFNDVKDFSKKYDVPISVILAIIETESSYNPRAISSVPAFGLMQLVPKTAGVDAHNYVYGKKKVVTPDFLFDETNNLQLGTAYFKLLKSRYLRKIKDPQSRYYCAVASYNTGVGNLAKTFIGNKNLSKAAKKINTMSPDQVYNYLLENLPAQETKNYLKKIVARTEKYQHFDSINTEI